MSAQMIRASSGHTMLRGRRALLVPVIAAGLFVAMPMLRRMIGPPSSGTDLNLHAQPRDLPDLRFTDGSAKATSLAAFHSRVVLLNVWATWCPPCREEMPMLDRLQATLGGPGFEVVALSIDEGAMPAVQTFFDRTGIKHLRPYLDAFGDALSALAAAGVPLTLLIDANGQELARKLGPAAWDHPRVVESIRGLVRVPRPPDPARR
jgi:thiol-disulfide isomerase/thioredoxin